MDFYLYMKVVYGSYGAERLGLSLQGNGIVRIAGMKLRERIDKPTFNVSNYKNTAFLRRRLPYLDGIFFKAANFRYLLLNYPEDTTTSNNGVSIFVNCNRSLSSLLKT